LARIPGLDDLKDQERRLEDIANKLDSIVASSAKYADNVKSTNEEYKDLTRVLDDQVQKMQNIKAQGGIIDQKDIDLANQYVRSMEKLADKANKLVGLTSKLSQGFDKLGKGLLMLWGSAASKGINLLIDGIQRVYDLEERWAKVTGEVNQKLGKLSPGMKQFWKESRQAESAIRGLGGELGEGTKMFAEFTQGFAKMDVKGMAKVGVQLAQGFDMGGEAAGKFTRSLDNLGFDERKKEVSGYMKEIVVGADTAGVSVNSLAKDFAESTNFLAGFGKTGAKVLIKSTAYLKQFNISLKDTEKMMDKFDSFEDAATSVGKFNAVFGTSVNALNLMLEQDPAKRFESFRTAMLDQGKDWESLSRQERKVFAQTVDLSEDQAAALLKAADAGKSYEQFMADDAKSKKRAIDAEKMMKTQLQATAKTLYNFGAAADRITVAIANAIKPFTDLLGLTKSGDKQWKSFGQVMEYITKKIIDFFNALGKNQDFQNFMKMGAKFVKEVAVKIADFFSPNNLGRNLQKIIDGLKSFAKVSAVIIAMWAGSKIFSGVKGGIGLVKDIASLTGMGKTIAGAKAGISGAISGGAGPMGGAAGGGMGVMGKMGIGGAAGGLAGAGIGSLFGATAGGGIGGGVGGAIGSIFGPIGGLIGTTLGTAIGIGVQKLLETPESKELEASMKRLSQTQDMLEVSEAQLNLQRVKNEQLKERRDRADEAMNKVIKQGKKGTIQLSAEESQSLNERLKDYSNLGIQTNLSADTLRKLGDPAGGPIKLTREQLEKLKSAGDVYHQTLTALDTESKKYLDNLFQTNQLDLEKKKADAAQKQLEAEVALAEKQKKNADDQGHWYDSVLGSTAELIDSVGLANENSKAWSDQLAATKYASDQAEAKLQRLQARRNDVETDALKIGIEQNKMQQARLELESLEKYNSGFQAILKDAGGDYVKALDKYGASGGKVSSETLGYVKAQARSSKAVGSAPPGMTFDPDVVTQGTKKGGRGGDTHVTVMTPDGDVLGRATAKSYQDSY
jgi:hypothetical protein